MPEVEGESKTEDLQKEYKIKLEDLYKQIFDAHRSASDYRVKIISGWLAIYAALAAAYSWLATKDNKFIWALPLVAIIVTIIMWFADRRNKRAIQRAKEIGVNIEEEAGLPKNLSFFRSIEAGVSHTTIINYFAVTAVTAFFLAFIYLISRATNTPPLTNLLSVGLITLSLIIIFIILWFAETSQPALQTKQNNIKAKAQMPLPFVMGGIGLFLAYIFKEGISGWQGFLIGFVAGFVIPAIITMSSGKSNVLHKESGK